MQMMCDSSSQPSKVLYKNGESSVDDSGRKGSIQILKEVILQTNPREVLDTGLKSVRPEST